MSRHRLLFVAVSCATLALILWCCLKGETGVVVQVTTAADLSPATTPAATETATAAEANETSDAVVRRHAVHPKQDVLWVERMHEVLGLPLLGALEPELKASIEASLSRGCENNTSPEAQARLEQLMNSPSPTARKRYHQQVHGIALLFGELEALVNDCYIRYGGGDFTRFYEKCMNHYPDHYFACVGCDREGRQILLVVPAPSGSQIASAADAALALAQQGY